MMKKEMVMKLLEMLLSEGEKKECVKPKAKPESAVRHRLTGDHVIIRARDAGVHFGVLESVHGRHVVLSNSRRMWRWWSATEMTLTAVAKFGLNESKSELRIQSEMETQDILDACEILPCSKACIESFARVEPYNEQ